VIAAANGGPKNPIAPTATVRARVSCDGCATRVATTVTARFSAKSSKIAAIAWHQKGQVAKQLKTGDSRAAMVVSVSPLMVAAYMDEMDCVVLLKFPDALVTQYGLKERARLLTVNFYDRDPGMACDLCPGPKNTKRWTNFGPLIADFLTDDQQRLTMRKKQISDSEWQRTWTMGQEYLKRHSNQIRDGRQIYSWDTIQTAEPVLKTWSPK
jgi:hypothetical protein